MTSGSIDCFQSNLIRVYPPHNVSPVLASKLSKDVDECLDWEIYDN